MLGLFLLIILFLVFASSTLTFYALFPLVEDKYGRLQRKKAQAASRVLEEMYIWVAQQKLILLFGLTPIILGVIFFGLFGNKLLILAGFIVGLGLPSIVLKQMERMRRKKFHSQLIDALISLSQSLKAGLSLLQALEVLVEEMPPPLSQEFSLIIKENKMGILLEDSFERLNKKMKLEDLNLLTTAILVARETGGSLTDIFIHLSDSIRNKNKIADQVKTLTTQARWQAVIMSFLPLVFAAFVFNINRNAFNIMWESDKGRLMLIWCVVSEIIGVFILRRLSRVEV